MKHLLKTLADLTPECQAGVYCPECAELCPVTVTTVIHCCLNCGEAYCLLCAHEFHCCLTCEADAEAWTTVPPLLYPFDADYTISSDQLSKDTPQTPAKSSPQFKVAPAVPKGKRIKP